MSGGSEETQPDPGGSSKPKKRLEARNKGGGSKDSSIVGAVNNSEACKSDVKAADCSNVNGIQTTGSGGGDREQLNTLIEEVSNLLRSYLDELKSLGEDGSEQLLKQGEYLNIDTVMSFSFI